jgi:DNA-binding response OmpR family regulator
MAINILVVDDDKDIRRGVRIYLEREGYQVLEAENGQAALEQLESAGDVQLVIMDVMMPIMDGNLAAMQIRAQGYKMPIIMLSAKSEAADKIEGLTVGADDYVTKPFHAMELMAHVKAQLRRYLDLGPASGQTTINDHQLVVRGLVLDQEAKQVTIDGRPVKMTPKEFQITELLMKHPGRVYSVDEIYEYVWNEPSFAAENTVAVHIRKIREKIEVNPKQPEYLKVVWGVGYKIEK